MFFCSTAPAPSRTISSLSVTLRPDASATPSSRAFPAAAVGTRPLTVTAVFVTAMSTGPKPLPLRGSFGMTSASHAAESTADCTSRLLTTLSLSKRSPAASSIELFSFASRTGPSSVMLPAATWTRSVPARDRRQRRRRAARRATFVVRRDRKHDEDEQRGRPARENALGVHRGDATARHHAQTTRARAAGAAELRLRCEREAICARRDRHRREPPPRRAGRRRLLGGEPRRAGERVGADRPGWARFVGRLGRDPRAAPEVVRLRRHAADADRAQLA